MTVMGRMLNNDDKFLDFQKVISYHNEQAVSEPLEVKHPIIGKIVPSVIFFFILIQNCFVKQTILQF